jgi:16S rRNA C1402 N4-methylase RsmH
MPVCGCGARVEGRLLVRHSITPSPRELASNPRSRSAQLRAIQRLPGPGHGGEEKPTEG